MNKVIIRVIHDRQKTATRTHAAAIYLEIRANGKERKFLSTNIKVCKNQFKSGRVVGREDAESLNERINSQITEINKIVAVMDDRRQVFSVSMLDNLNDAYKSVPSFLDFLENRINDRPIRDTTKQQHRKVLNFLRTEYPHIRQFTDLSVPAIIRLDDYLHSRKLPNGEKMMQTSIHNYHKILKTYINDAVRLDYTPDNPYNKWKSTVGHSQPRTVLTMDEITAIRTFCTRSTLLAKVRDLFVVQCYTGLAYADLMATDFTLAELHNGTLILPPILRHKTGTPFSLVLLPPVVEILNRYNMHLPRLAYDVYNRNLKALATAAGIDKTVTTHVGRHTFATTIALGSGVPIEIVSKMMGHTDIKTTQIYAKILPEQVINGFASISQKIG